MKKSLIALAALATVATAAQAQSSVTIYGVLDVGLATVNNVAEYTNANSGTTAGTPSSTVKRVTGMQNGGAATSRLGFRGTEDLGGGLKANFVLEAELLADDGSTKSSAEALFNRASWVGLSGNFGTTQFGRINTFSYGEGAKFDPFGGGNLGGYLAVGQYGYTRIENALQYISPKFNGLSVGFQTGTKTAGVESPYENAASPASSQGELAGKTSGNRNTALLATYDNGPVELSVSYGKQNSATGRTDDVTTLFARYTIGQAKLIAGYMQQDPEAPLSSTVKELTSTFLGAHYSVTPALTLKAMAGQYENKTSTATQKPKVYTLGANYALSKRTDIYVVGAKSSQDNSSKLAIASTSKFSYTGTNGLLTGGMTPVADKDQTGYMVGIRHTF